MAKVFIVVALALAIGITAFTFFQTRQPPLRETTALEPTKPQGPGFELIRRGGQPFNGFIRAGEHVLVKVSPGRFREGAVFLAKGTQVSQLWPVRGEMSSLILAGGRVVDFIAGPGEAEVVVMLFETHSSTGQFTDGGVPLSADAGAGSARFSKHVVVQ